MKKAKLVITVAASALLAADLVGGSTSAATNDPAAPTVPVGAKKLATLSRAEVRRLLAKIEKSARPEPQMGAMCYKMARPPSRAEYVCPTCGERTLYTDREAELVERELATCQSLFRELPRHETMELDESAFCRKCRPQATEPELTLTIRFDDGTTSVVRGVRSEDLRMLGAVLSGKLTETTSNEGEEPLKDQLPRLRELLGANTLK